MQTRTRKIWRDLSTRKARTLLVSLSIFIGVLGVVTLFTMGDLMVSQLESDLREDKLAMTRIYVAINSQENIDNTPIIEALNDQPMMENTTGLALFPVYWKKEADAQFEEGRIFAYTQALDNLPIQPNELIDGRYPESGSNEVVVERRFADAHGVGIGDTLLLRILSNGVNSEDAWTIVGTVFMPYQYPIVPGGPTYIQGKNMIFANYEDAQHITGSQGVNLFLTRYQDFATAKAQSETIERYLAEETPYVPTTVIVEDPAENPYILQARSFRDVMALLAIVALLVSGFLVFNVINALVFEQRRQIGVMKSLGADGRDTFMMYAGLSLVYGLIGVIPGVLLGIPLGYSATKSLEEQLYFFLEDFAISPPAILMGIFLGIFIPLLAAVVPILSGLRVTILEAMTDLGIGSKYGRGFMARLVNVVPLPMSIRQALRNVIQKRGRLALTVLTLSLAAGAFMGVFAMLVSLQTVVDDIFDTFNFQISLTPSQTQELETVANLVQNNISDIAWVEPGGAIAIEIEGYEPQTFGAGSAALYALGTNAENPDTLDFDLRSGSAWYDDSTRSGVVITAGIADELGVDSGDTITIRTGANTRQFEVIGVSNYPFDTVWMRWDELSSFGGLTRGAPTPNQYFANVEIDGQTVLASGMNEMAQAALTLTDGEFLTMGEPQIILTEAMAESGGYAVGDSLRLNIGENSAEYTVAGIFNINPQFASPDQPADMVALYWEDLAQLEGRNLAGDPIPNAFNLRLTTSDPTAEQVEAKMDEINELMLNEGITANFTNWVASADQVSQLIQTTAVILNTAAFLIAAVGAIGLFSTLSMSVFERQKEIGVMRSIGAVSSAISTQFLIEGWIVGIISWAVGVPLSFLLFNALITTFNFGDAVGVSYTPSTILIGLVGMLVIATISSLWPSVAAARKTVSDILRYQ